MFRLRSLKADGSPIQASTSPLWLTPQKGSATNTPIDESVYSDPASSGSTFKWDSTAQQDNGAKSLTLQLTGTWVGTVIVEQSNDSTAFGIGAADNRESIAGRLAADFPTARVVNRGVNGKKTAALVRELKEEQGHFDLIVIQIGGNDIIRFSNTEVLRQDISEVLALAKTKSDRVVLFTSGDVGKAPFFPPLLNRFWSNRTAAVRDIFRAEAGKHGVIYVDLLEAKVSNLFLTDIPRYYSADLLHPSGDGYAVWYAEMKRVLEQNGDWKALILRESEKIRLSRSKFYYVRLYNAARTYFQENC